MKAYRLLIEIMFFVCLSSFFISYCLYKQQNSFWLTVLLGIFASGFVLLIDGIINFLVIRRKTLSQIYIKFNEFYWIQRDFLIYSSTAGGGKLKPVKILKINPKIFEPNNVRNNIYELKKMGYELNELFKNIESFKFEKINKILKEIEDLLSIFQKKLDEKDEYIKLCHVTYPTLSDEYINEMRSFYEDGTEDLEIILCKLEDLAEKYLQIPKIIENVEHDEI
ncbi:hypothetical protein [Methanimicrococcus blatticola]|uniref:5-bromo-4-chloroindolyl phosphate hydrolysis protein n=1 Tax=Methanimicrococcus blatticola TaxID=91560 RepID=A0A484F7F3_9EURY|nr:hypothetical protein [Methanimicrococcus blatticola]MBZ3934984.1 hypothetical protein [Methanimicrococcus blatticola]MCC2508918.1 hypothetical protein [Methanimicrococcus blatticola]TDQ71055.1 hypothetical protein C7391_0154 [Methanimicrococcus blatticola]